MRRIWAAAAGLVAMGCAALGGVAWAADGGIQAKIDLWSGYAVYGGICGKIGYRVHRDALDRIGALTATEAASYGMPEDQMAALIDAANDRHSSELQAEMEALAATMASTKDQGEEAMVAAAQTALAAFVDRMDKRCVAAALDPYFRLLVETTPSAELAAGRRNFMDEYLAPIGGASWQNARMRAQALLLFDAGACSTILPAARIGGYKAGVLDGPEPADPAKARIRRYYADNYEQGQKHGAELDLDSETCGKVLAEDATALKATP